MAVQFHANRNYRESIDILFHSPRPSGHLNHLVPNSILDFPYVNNRTFGCGVNPL